MQFEVRWEGQLAASPEAIWDGLTRHSAGYLWEIEYEPRVGGAERGLTSEGGTVTAWEPPRHFQTRSESGDNQLDYVFEPRGDGTYLRYVHNGTAADASVVEACEQHTRFYLFSLGESAHWFGGREPAYVGIEVDASFPALLQAVGVGADVAVGERVAFGEFEGVVDYCEDTFLGVRSAVGLHRVYGRAPWGAPSTVAHHLFGASVDAAAVRRAWEARLSSAVAEVA